MRYVGFDMGDGESAVAAYEHGSGIEPVILPVQGYRSLLSAVGTIGGEIVVGEQAYTSALAQDTFGRFLTTLLRYGDRNSMAHSREVRLPFCDHRIAEYLYATPWPMKELGGHEKGLLRRAMAGMLPEKVLTRKKSPYPKTHNPAYAALMRERLADILATPNAPIWTLVKPGEAARLIDREPPQNWYGQLMTGPQTIAYLLQLDYWLRKYRVRIL